MPPPERDDTPSRFVDAVFAWATAPGERRSWITPVWATVKAVVAVCLSPIAAPVFARWAATNHRRAVRRVRRLPQALAALGRSPAGPEAADLGRVIDIAASARILIVSDLHRCTTGHPDWPSRQGTADIYGAMLEHYGAEGWTLCENGDVDDFWMLGGSAGGTVYDILRTAGAALAAAGRPRLLESAYVRQLDAIVANNVETYRLVRERFGRTGRYLRTIGNHDDAMSREEVSGRLAHHVGGLELADAFALRHSDGTLAGVICHGHLTDGWNAPGRDRLGKLSTWFASTLADVPLLAAPNGLPGRAAAVALLSGSARNDLVQVHPTFGANANYDSLDEELLFDALEPTSESPWLFLGHTHYPMSSPRSASGDIWHRYLNSGSGIVPDIVTGIEWNGTGGGNTARLVAWTWADMAPPGSVEMCSLAGRGVSRFVLEHDPDSRSLRIASVSV